uniref:(northern house mosquito) hypothetical protein n=1 Tax=Culex pipiens TaxID=7175 RepID=A0A8D8AD70_CULPI
MYRRRPVSTGAVLPIDRLLLVRARGHGQEHSRHVDQGQATPVRRLSGRWRSSDAGLPGRQEAGVSAGFEGLFEAADCEQLGHGCKQHQVGHGRREDRHAQLCPAG